MLIAKTDLLKPLRAMAGFDPKGSPYAAVQLIDDLPPQLFRSAGDGIIQTKQYGLAPTTYVGLANFIDVLKSFPSDSVELSVTERGILRIGGDSAVHDDVAHVHTVSEGQAGVKRHDIGARVLVVDPLAFSGLDVRPFCPLINPPVLANGKLMLPTNKGAIVVWRGERLDLGLKGDGLYPRETVLRYVTAAPSVDELVVTANGYWGAVVGDLVTYSKGHRVGRQIFDLYDTPGAELARMPAERLVSCLNAVLGLMADTDRVDVDPRLGVVAKGAFGDSRHPLGETGTWERFGMQAKVAKVCAAALSQATDDYAILESATPGAGSGPAAVLRLRRGPFEVSFRSF